MGVVGLAHLRGGKGKNDIPRTDNQREFQKIRSIKFIGGGESPGGTRLTAASRLGDDRAAKGHINNRKGRKKKSIC